MSPEMLGFVRHYDRDAREASVRIDQGDLHEGDRIRIVGHGHDVVEPVRGLELERDHQEVREAHRGQIVDFFVDFPVEVDDLVFLLRSDSSPSRRGARPPASARQFP